MQNLYVEIQVSKVTLETPIGTLATVHFQITDEKDLLKAKGSVEITLPTRTYTDAQLKTAATDQFNLIFYQLTKQISG